MTHTSRLAPDHHLERRAPLRRVLCPGFTSLRVPRWLPSPHVAFQPAGANPAPENVAVVAEDYEKGHTTPLTEIQSAGDEGGGDLDGGQSSTGHPSERPGWRQEHSHRAPSHPGYPLPRKMPQRGGFVPDVCPARVRRMKIIPQRPLPSIQAPNTPFPQIPQSSFVPRSSPRTQLGRSHIGAHKAVAAVRVHPTGAAHSLTLDAGTSFAALQGQRSRGLLADSMPPQRDSRHNCVPIFDAIRPFIAPRYVSSILDPAYLSLDFPGLYASCIDLFLDSVRVQIIDARCRSLALNEFFAWLSLAHDAHNGTRRPCASLVRRELPAGIPS
uniref:Uncharacterized protein n=1 Tax=Mycena chlorophos TaxID=658473 RepID=A0ABQ0LSU8_MYCCL|nr:predicted protein [Mycena chlorophos]